MCLSCHVHGSFVRLLIYNSNKIDKNKKRANQMIREAEIGPMRKCLWNYRLYPEEKVKI